ncbi:cupin domain-containing protein [Spirosoma sp. BT702]|uniref:Cupin domain-containing protein n=1 Tax=Spirosoma profusum TaxID=2771354 RepID=A0A926XV18_9BACT|nr:cupin domain-containing protein [Spirosoma profusum]MBD2700330.1 cupin domain-containing protein [Spirosoma profusum]
MAFANKIIQNPKTGQQLRFIRTSKDTNGEVLEMESTYRSRSIEPAPHYHPNQVEDFRVVAGELTVTINGQTNVLRPGDTLHVPANTIHSMWNASDANTVVNWQVRPALNTEAFFETTFGLASDGKVKENGMPPFLQTVTLARHFSNVFRLAKPPKVIQQVIFGLLSPIARLVGYRPVYQKYLD